MFDDLLYLKFQIDFALFMTHVKICGITNLEDALAAIEAGADALGFNFYRHSPRFREPRAARQIIAQMPDKVSCVGVYVNEDAPEQVARIADEAGVDIVQLHGDESPEFCRALRQTHRVIKALRVSESFASENALSYEAEAILLDAYSPRSHGGTGSVFDWAVARRTREIVSQLYLAGGLAPENVREAINHVEPYAVDACSLIERAPGRKDHGRMRDFIAAARRKA